jgi:Skp family chaperone for outer membrane proteins
LAFLAALIAVSGFQGQTTAQAPKSEPYRPKMALVNIAKVLKDYEKANAMGKQISELRKGYLDRVDAYRKQMTDMNKEMMKTPDISAKEKIQSEMTAIQRKIEDIDREAQAKLGEMSNNTVVSVYKEIKETIAAIAESNGLELVLAYPDASEAKDMDSPVVAQLKLQTPALMPFYHKNLDITSYVIQTLNQRYPAPKAVGGTTPDNSIKPVSGSGK